MSAFPSMARNVHTQARIPGSNPGGAHRLPWVRLHAALIHSLLKTLLVT